MPAPVEKEKIPAPEPFTKPKQLVVEGRDEKEFFIELFKILDINDIQIQMYDGKEKLTKVLGGIVRASGFLDEIDTLAIIRDADDNRVGAFQSVSESLKKANLTAPSSLKTFTTSNPRVGVFIMPNNNENGMLETLCLEAVGADPAFYCIDKFFTCLTKRGHITYNMHKARFHTYLSSRREPGKLLGIAAQCGYLNLEHDIYKDIKDFLRAM